MSFSLAQWFDLSKPIRKKSAKTPRLKSLFGPIRTAWILTEKRFERSATD
jgi:hypothetical protein